MHSNQEAISISKKAIKMNSTDPKIWNRMGYIFCAMGKFDDAISCFIKATELAPQVVAYQESLAISYSIIEQWGESKRLLEAARKLSGNQVSPLQDIYEEAISGNKEGTLKLLRGALATNKITRNDIRRDPNINILFDRQQIDSLVA